MKPLKFRGVYKDYIWGGNKMRSKYGITTDTDPIAESWVLSCHKDGMSVIESGEYEGMALDEFIRKNPSVLGTDCKWDELPILIKFIDAADNLSVQVHPNNEQAKVWENQNGKTEMWYVIEADKGAKITYGVKEDITSKELSDAIKNNTVESLLNASASQKGDVFFVEAGTIHAIGKGNLIAEIQQNSNVTYRLYDYDRRGKDGKPRELHIDKGVKSSKTTKTAPRNIPVCSDSTRMVGSCEYFQVKELVLSKTPKKLCCSEKSYQALIQTDGEAKLCFGSEEVTVKAGETVFLPAGFGEYSVVGSGVMLIAANPPRYFVGIDLGGTNIAAAVVDEYGTVYGRAKRKTNAPRPYNEIFDDMALCAKEAAVLSGISFDDVESVGIGSPGAINKETGTIEYANNLGFYDVPVVEYMEKTLSKKVYIENDANAAAWGEFLAGCGKNYDSMIMITLGTGVGSGIINNGKIFRGAYGTGAELGHMTLLAGGHKCTCGRKGCFETYSSATALVRMTKEAMKKNPDSDMWRICGGKLSKANGRTAFKAKDSAAKAVVKEYLGYLTEGIVSIINMFQPNIICIGGGISHEGRKLLAPIEKGVKKYSYGRFSKKQTVIDLATLGNDAGIIGAALLWKDANN
ncbi:MAG: ROK family protein [Clostridia bacterium]|nr:ROK family protein [Clostridia bacterium]